MTPDQQRAFALLVRDVNLLARTLKETPLGGVLVDVKSRLISTWIEDDSTTTRMRYERQSNGHVLVMIGLGNYYAPHVPFPDLSASAKARVLNVLGTPQSFQRSQEQTQEVVS